MRRQEPAGPHGLQLLPRGGGDARGPGGVQQGVSQRALRQGDGGDVPGNTDTRPLRHPRVLPRAL